MCRLEVLVHEVDVLYDLYQIQNCANGRAPGTRDNFFPRRELGPVFVRPTPPRAFPR